MATARAMASRTKQIELVASLLKTESTLALATTDPFGLAMIAPLFYIADDALVLYWISARTAQHSINLKRQPHASVTIYRHTDEWKSLCGVQMTGCASPVGDSSQRKVLIGMYSERFCLGTIFRNIIARSTLYSFRPIRVHYIDNSKYFGYKFDLKFADVGS